MTSELEPTFRDKLTMLKEQHFPLVEKSEIVAASYEMPNLGPWDMNFEGMPKFGKITVPVVLMATYIVIIYTAVRFELITGFWFDRLTAIAIVFGFLAVAGAMWILISLNTATFQHYKRVIDYIWRDLSGREPIRKGELRVKRIVQLWPMGKERLDRYAKMLESEFYVERVTDEPQIMALPQIGPKMEQALLAKGYDSLLKIARAKPEELDEIRGITKDMADTMIGSAKNLILEQLKQEEDKTDEELEKAAAQAIKDLTTVEKLSSTYRLNRLIHRVRGITSAPEMRDPVKEAINLKLEFIRIVGSLDSEFVYSLLECAGDLYVLVISRFSLTGGDDEERKKTFTEFRDHDMTQRTYVYQGTNTHGTWGVFTHLADYKYIQIPERKYLLAGKEERVKWAPIAFLNYSDGQAELDDEQIRKERFTPTGNDILQAELVYGASVAEKCLETIKLLTATVSRLKETINSIWREAMDWAKGVIAKAVEKILLEEKLRKEGGLRTWFTNLISNTAVKYVVYLLGLFGLYILFGFVVGQLFPQIQLWPWGGGEGGGGGSTPNPYNP